MVNMKTLAGIATIALILAIGPTIGTTANAATPTVGLGTAATFAVLAAAGVTNTHAAGTQTVVNGDLGTHPTPAITGFPPGTVNGVIHPADATALTARNDLKAAYIDAQGRTPFSVKPAALGGTILTPGVYRATPGGGFDITGTLTLDGQGDATAVFIFQIPASTLITAGASNVSLIGSAQSCNVFWQVGSSATLGASSTFRGNILADTTISAGQNAIVDGRLLAGAVTDSGAVTLIDDSVTKATCASSAVPPPPPPPAPGQTSTPGCPPLCLVPTLTPVPTMAPLGPIVTPAPTASPVPTASPTPSPAPAIVQLPSTGTSGDSPIAALGVLLAGLGAAVLLRRSRRPWVDR